MQIMHKYISYENTNPNFFFTFFVKLWQNSTKHMIVLSNKIPYFSEYIFMDTTVWIRITHKYFIYLLVCHNRSIRHSIVLSIKQELLNISRKVVGNFCWKLFFKCSLWGNQFKIFFQIAPFLERFYCTVQLQKGCFSSMFNHAYVYSLFPTCMENIRIYLCNRTLFLFVNRGRTNA